MNTFLDALVEFLMDGAMFRVGTNLTLRFSEQLRMFELGVFDETKWTTSPPYPLLDCIDYTPVYQSCVLEDCIEFLGEAIARGNESRENYR